MMSTFYRMSLTFYRMSLMAILMVGWNLTLLEGIYCDAKKLGEKKAASGEQNGGDDILKYLTKEQESSTLLEKQLINNQNTNLNKIDTKNSEPGNSQGSCTSCGDHDVPKGRKTENRSVGDDPPPIAEDINKSELKSAISELGEGSKEDSKNAKEALKDIKKEQKEEEKELKKEEKENVLLNGGSDTSSKEEKKNELLEQNNEKASQFLKLMIAKKEKEDKTTLADQIPWDERRKKEYRPKTFICRIVKDTGEPDPDVPDSEMKVVQTEDDSLEPVLLYGDLMRICGVTAENILFRISALDDDKPWRRTPKFVRNITPAEQKRNNENKAKIEAAKKAAAKNIQEEGREEEDHHDGDEEKKETTRTFLQKQQKERRKEDVVRPDITEGTTSIFLQKKNRETSTFDLYDLSGAEDSETTPEEAILSTVVDEDVDPEVQAASLQEAELNPKDPERKKWIENKRMEIKNEIRDQASQHLVVKELPIPEYATPDWFPEFEGEILVEIIRPELRNFVKSFEKILDLVEDNINQYGEHRWITSRVIGKLGNREINYENVKLLNTDDSIEEYAVISREEVEKLSQDSYEFDKNILHVNAAKLKKEMSDALASGSMYPHVEDRNDKEDDLTVTFKSKLTQDQLSNEDLVVKKDGTTGLFVYPGDSALDEEFYLDWHLNHKHDSERDALWEKGRVMYDQFSSRKFRGKLLEKLRNAFRYDMGVRYYFVEKWFQWAQREEHIMVKYRQARLADRPIYSEKMLAFVSVYSEFRFTKQQQGNDSIVMVSKLAREEQKPLFMQAYRQAPR